MTSSGILKRLLADLAGQQGGRLKRVWGLMIAGSLVDSLGILLLVPITALLLDQRSALAGGRLATLDDRTALVMVAILFLTAMLLRALIAFARDRASARLHNDYEFSLRVRLMAGLADSGWPRARMVGSSMLHRLLWMETARTGSALGQFHAMAISVLLLIIQFGFALALAPGFALFALGLFLVGGAIALPLARASRRRGAAIGDALAAIGDDGHRMQVALKSAMAERETGDFLERYRASAHRLADAEVALATGIATSRGISAMLAALAATALLLAGVLLFETPVALLLPLLIIFARLSGPAQQALQSWLGMVGQIEAFARIDPWLGRIEAQDKAGEPIDWKTVDLDRAVVDTKDRFRLGPVSMTITRGDSVAITGPSGSGKSLLLDLLSGLLPADEGSIEVDGQAMTGPVAQGWARGLAYVGQDSLLMGGTLAECLGSDDETEFRKCATIVGLDSERFDLSTPIGPGGTLLSGGERQRVALLRGLMRQPTLLILDEATASLDLEAEQQVLANIREAMPGCSIVLVSHRPQSVVDFDHVVTLVGGRVVDIAGPSRHYPDGFGH